MVHSERRPARLQPRCSRVSEDVLPVVVDTARGAPLQIVAGTIIAERYEVEARLGRGGMASVYRVRHLGLGSRHALKVLQYADADLAQRLVREGQLQGSLSHPNVLKVSDLVEVDGAPGLVLEYVAGWTLAEVLARGPLSAEQVDWLARGILSGVVAAHAHGLIHRDLKPSNVLLAWADGVAVPKVADFGLARAVDAATLADRLTRGALGTPGYMAPEQVVDAASADHRADVFSLGALLYELVTTERAFDGENVYAVLESVRAGSYVPPGDRVDQLPPRWERAIVGALQPDLESRIPDTASLLQTWTEDRPPPTPPTDWPLPEPEDPEQFWLSSVALEPEHPTLDDLMERAEETAIATHLQACAACRLDLRLYRETFALEPELPAVRPPWQMGLVASLVAVPLVLGVLIMTAGQANVLPDGGVFSVLLLVAGIAEVGLLTALGVRVSRGRADSLQKWLAPCLLPALVGTVGAAVGIGQMAGVLVEAENPAELFEMGLPMALRVEWSGWVLAALGLLVAAAALTRETIGGKLTIRWPPVALSVVGGLGLWLGAVWLQTDSVATFFAWLVLVAATLTVSGIPAADERGWRVGLLSSLAVVAAARAAHVSNVQAAPLADLGFDGLFCAGWVAVVALSLGIALRTTPRPPPARHWVSVGFLLAIAAATSLWVDWVTAVARGLLG